MIVFLDFEASSLGDGSYPIEVGWVWEDGREEAHLIRPAPAWTDWSAKSEAIHGITRAELERDGAPHGEVARRMVAELTGHDLRASAPSWDGHWMSVLLRAAGLPRHALRLADSDDLLAEAARAALGASLAGEVLTAAVQARLAASRDLGPPAHRALADARAMHARWLRLREAG